VPLVFHLHTNHLEGAVPHDTSPQQWPFLPLRYAKRALHMLKEPRGMPKGPDTTVKEPYATLAGMLSRARWEHWAPPGVPRAPTNEPRAAHSEGPRTRAHAKLEKDPLACQA